jgi:hypothetical protein
MLINQGIDLNHSYFRVRTKGGVTIVFGNPANATGGGNQASLDATIRFEDHPDRPVLAFAESAAIDTAGNFISFHYQSNKNGDYNITEIDYTGHGTIDEKAVLSIDQNPYASMTFIYEFGDGSKKIRTQEV